jgi:MATE family multidrug resistance protein
MVMNTLLYSLRSPTGAFGHWRRESAAIVTLALPLALTMLSHIAMVTTDVVMMGRLGPQSLAASTLANHLYWLFDMFAMGLVGAVVPILAQHLGARRFRQVRRAARQGFWAAAIIAVPCTAAIWQTQAILALFGQDPDLSRAAQDYLRAMVPGFLPGLWFIVLSGFLAAHTRPRATLVVAILGIGINGLADYALMFGHFGLPALGLAGAGYASALVSSFMFLGLLAFVSLDWRLRRYRLLGRFWRADWPQLREIFHVGLPIAVTVLAEIGLFTAAALLMGLLGTASLAAHGIAVQCCAIAYMVADGIAKATMVRVGRAAGAGDDGRAARAGWAGMSLGLAYGLLPAAAFWFLGSAITDLYLEANGAESASVTTFAVSFLAVAALFQIADCTQVTAMGALRGLKDTRAPMLIALAGYWGLGLPFGAVFGIYLKLGGEAIWSGLAVGLMVVSGCLIWRFRILSNSRRAGKMAEIAASALK